MVSMPVAPCVSYHHVGAGCRRSHWECGERAWSEGGAVKTPASCHSLSLPSPVARGRCAVCPRTPGLDGMPFILVWKFTFPIQFGS